MSEWIEVEPAYGRDYTNQAAAKKDWNDGKDFRDTFSGRYVGKGYADANGLKVIIRYAKGLKVVSVSG